jgi:hypothetical protein
MAWRLAANSEAVSSFPNSPLRKWRISRTEWTQWSGTSNSRGRRARGGLPGTQSPGERRFTSRSAISENFMQRLSAFPVVPLDDSDDIACRGTTCGRRNPFARKSGSRSLSSTLNQEFRPLRTTEIVRAETDPFLQCHLREALRAEMKVRATPCGEIHRRRRGAPRRQNKLKTAAVGSNFPAFENRKTAKTGAASVSVISAGKVGQPAKMLPPPKAGCIFAPKPVPVCPPVHHLPSVFGAI